MGRGVMPRDRGPRPSSLGTTLTGNGTVTRTVIANRILITAAAQLPFHTRLLTAAVLAAVLAEVMAEVMARLGR